MAADETDRDPKSPPDARLDSLDERLGRAQHEEAVRAGRVQDRRAQHVVRSAGMRILSDLVGLPLGGFVVGYVLDRLFGTMPWITLAMLFLGFGLAVRNVMRVASQDRGSTAGE